MNIYESIRYNFEEIINSNLKTDKLLSKNKLKCYRRLILKNKNNLKFYKYCNDGDNTIKNIENNTLPFKKYSEFNDPFEGISICDNKEDKRYMNTIRDNAMISCLSETKNNILMFAHYSNSFKGICIEYDLSLLSNEMSYILNYFFPVIYAKKPSDLKNKNILNNGIKRTLGAYEKDKISLVKLDDIISYFIHKADLWAYEREWRFIVPLDQYKFVFNINNNKQKVILLNNFDCISSIYLGLNCKNTEFINSIREIVERHNIERVDGKKIKVYETKLNDYEYKLDAFEVL